MTPFEPEQFKGKLTTDLIDADTGEVKLPAGERMTPRARAAGCARRASSMCWRRTRS